MHSMVELLISLNSPDNKIEDPATIEMWHKRARFFLRVAELGKKEAMDMEYPGRRRGGRENARNGKDNDEKCQKDNRKDDENDNEEME